MVPSLGLIARHDAIIEPRLTLGWDAIRFVNIPNAIGIVRSLRIQSQIMLARVLFGPDDIIYENWVNIEVNARIQRVNQFVKKHQYVLCDTQVLFQVDLFLVGDWNLKIYFE